MADKLSWKFRCRRLIDGNFALKYRTSGAAREKPKGRLPCTLANGHAWLVLRRAVFRLQTGEKGHYTGSEMGPVLD